MKYIIERYEEHVGISDTLLASEGEYEGNNAREVLRDFLGDGAKTEEFPDGTAMSYTSPAEVVELARTGKYPGSALEYVEARPLEQESQK